MSEKEGQRTEVRVRQSTGLCKERGAVGACRPRRDTV